MPPPTGRELREITWAVARAARVRESTPRAPSLDGKPPADEESRHTTPPRVSDASQTKRSDHRTGSVEQAANHTGGNLDEIERNSHRVRSLLARGVCSRRRGLS